MPSTTTRDHRVALCGRSTRRTAKSSAGARRVTTQAVEAASEFVVGSTSVARYVPVEFTSSSSAPSCAARETPSLDQRSSAAPATPTRSATVPPSPEICW